MVIWVKKEAVNVNVDQRAVVKGTSGYVDDIVKEVRNSGIVIELLETNEEFTIHPRHVIGIEITSHLTIMFKCTGFKTQII